MMTKIRRTRIAFHEHAAVPDPDLEISGGLDHPDP